MNVGTLKTRISQRLDDSDPGTFYSPGDILEAINKAQRLFVVISLCLEKTGDLTITAVQPFYTPRTTLTDWLVPLKVTTKDPQQIAINRRVKPATLHELDALDASWITRTHTTLEYPKRYCSMGFDFFAITPTPSTGNTKTITITYAHEPAALTADANTPAIPAIYHPTLIDGAIWLLRLREGGQELANAMDNFQRFIADALKMRNYTRARCQAQQYDLVPKEIALNDLSRMFRVTLQRQQPAA